MFSTARVRRAPPATITFRSILCARRTSKKHLAAPTSFLASICRQHHRRDNRRRHAVTFRLRAESDQMIEGQIALLHRPRAMGGGGAGALAEHHQVQQ